MKTLHVVTCESIPQFNGDDERLRAEFARQGCPLNFVVWDRADCAAFSAGDVVLIRTPWDYQAKRSAFETFLERLAAAEARGVQVLNPTAALRWNLDKRYLLTLQRRGHTIIPTALLDAFEPVAAASAARQFGCSSVMCKPVVGAGATGLVEVLADGTVIPLDQSGSAQFGVGAEVTPEGACLVQPKLDMRGGELSLLFFDGAFSHAVVKTPAAGDCRVQAEHGGATAAVDVPPRVVAAAAAALSEVSALVGHRLVYARVDGVLLDSGGTITRPAADAAASAEAVSAPPADAAVGTSVAAAAPLPMFHLMEVELIEPELFLAYNDAAHVTFASAVCPHLK